MLSASPQWGWSQCLSENEFSSLPSSPSPPSCAAWRQLPPRFKKRPAAVKKVRLLPVKKQLLVVGTTLTRPEAFSYPGVGREVRPIYIIRRSGAVGGNVVHVVLHSLMLQGDDNDISSPSLMVRTPGNSVGVAISQPRVEVRSASTLGTCIIR